LSSDVVLERAKTCEAVSGSKTCPAAFEDLSGHHLLDRHVTSDPSSQNRSTNRDVYVERNGRIEGVLGRLFEGEEAVLHVMGCR
jgi:hypothetical protein